MEAQVVPPNDVRFNYWEFEAGFSVTFWISPGTQVSTLVAAVVQADADFPWYYLGSDDQEWPTRVVIRETMAMPDGPFLVRAHHLNTRLTPVRFDAYSAYLFKLCQQLAGMQLPGVRWINWDLTLKSVPRGLQGSAQ